MIRTTVFVSYFIATAAFADGHNGDDRVMDGQAAEIRIQIEAEHEYSTNACEARLEVEYYQKGDSVPVETVLDNDRCAASGGSYTLQVRCRGGDGEVRTAEFEERWERSDAEPITLGKDYYVAENIDVMRVRSRRLRCECAPAPDDAGTGEQVCFAPQVSEASKMAWIEASSIASNSSAVC